MAPQSPDLNIMECVWDYMKKRDVRKPTSTEDLWLVLKDVWSNGAAEFLQKLCASVTRIDAVLKAKSGHTNYWFDLDFSFVQSVFCLGGLTLFFFLSILCLQHFYHTCRNICTVLGSDNSGLSLLLVEWIETKCIFCFNLCALCLQQTCWFCVCVSKPCGEQLRVLRLHHFVKFIF
ncbi:hypothetical protein GOODEAATRI_033293 [Goodea atripinnis]|uniref:Uncharacterized protein n=1 Tax=Goodea atripinnis TaxID=208336 RepID=A0ABV0MMP5_9TELE